MFARRTYYHVKPFLPWSLRMALRRLHARKLRASCAGVWPIDEAAGRPPEGWPGWPDGKRFALVLTHDVESLKGLGRCRQLMELEMRLGFRSSFNFVPEGEYSTPPELRDLLAANGFEVGVHDLRHDGKLYRSRSKFRENAEVINRYLAEWNAVGFRSGFMHHNLEWIHDLNILHDGSTFDTDPFEPQPDGVNTIFPFWVQGINGGGYVELPYTLVQDFNLFVVIKESSIDIWKKKLDWIVSRGGMALLIVHPDYANFPDAPCAKDEFPVALYEELLSYVKDKYAGLYWHALPREVAQFVRQNRQKSPFVPSTFSVTGQAKSPGVAAENDKCVIGRSVQGRSEGQTTPVTKASAGRILMLVENHFPSDPRVRNECHLLAEAGYSIVVVALRKTGERPSEMVNGIQVYRVPKLELFKKTAKGQKSNGLFLKLKSFAGYLGEYFYFTAACFVMSLYVAVKHGFDVIHAHNPPDTLFLVALPYKLFGKKFVFDHHDLSPELYQSRYGARRDAFAGVLQLIEKFSLTVADIIIATNESYKQVQIQRGGVRADRIFVVRNGPNASRMQPAPPNQRLLGMNKGILCYVGMMNPQDGVDYLLRSLRHLAFEINRRDFYCVIMGGGDSLDDLRALANDLNLNGLVELTGFIPEEDLLANLSAADICMDPDPSSPLNDVSTWIKIMEYMAYGKPIVTYDLKETRFSAQDAAIYVQPNDEMKFAAAIAYLMDQPGLRKKMGEFGRQRVEKELQWQIVSKNLVKAYEHLFQ